MRGSAWDTFADLPKVISFWKGLSSNGLLNSPESASFGMSYSMGNPSERMRISLDHALRVQDGKDILQFSLVARMKPSSGMPDDVMSCLDRGREWIVRAFTDMTTPEMHVLWKRRI